MNNDNLKEIKELLYNAQRQILVAHRGVWRDEGLEILERQMYLCSALTQLDSILTIMETGYET